LRCLLLSVETGESKRLTSFVGDNAYPEWSPDGSKIAFVTYELRKDRDDRDIYVIDLPDN